MNVHLLRTLPIPFESLHRRQSIPHTSLGVAPLAPTRTLRAVRRTARALPARASAPRPRRPSPHLRHPPPHPPCAPRARTIQWRGVRAAPALHRAPRAAAISDPATSTVPLLPCPGTHTYPAPDSHTRQSHEVYAPARTMRPHILRRSARCGDAYSRIHPPQHVAIRTDTCCNRREVPYHFSNMPICECATQRDFRSASVSLA